MQREQYGEYEYWFQGVKSKYKLMWWPLASVKGKHEKGKGVGSFGVSS